MPSQKPVLTTTHNDDGQIATWSLSAGATDGAPVSCFMFADRTVTVDGTFAGSSLSLQGNNDGGTTWYTLTTPDGGSATFSTGGMKLMVENPLFVKPTGSSFSSTTALSVILASRGGRKI